MLEVRGLTKSFGALRASDGIDFDVREGETHAVIGPNGAGKTTFISQLAGNLLPDAGRIMFAGEDITRLPAPRRARKGLARSFQITSVYPEFTARENVALAVQAQSGHSFRFWRGTVRPRPDRTRGAGTRGGRASGKKRHSGREPVARRAAAARGGHGARHHAAPAAAG